MRPVLNATYGRTAPTSAEAHEEEVPGVEEKGGGKDGHGRILFPEEGAPGHLV